MLSLKQPSLESTPLFLGFIIYGCEKHFLIFCLQAYVMSCLSRIPQHSRQAFCGLLRLYLTQSRATPRQFKFLPSWGSFQFCQPLFFQALGARASVYHLVTKAMNCIWDFYDSMLFCNNFSLLTYNHVKSTSTAGGLKVLSQFAHGFVGQGIGKARLLSSFSGSLPQW